ncbi:MAG: hypothetical protein ACJAYG_000088 [Oceanicoccus sp.]|jgi:hypothetical protein
MSTKFDALTVTVFVFSLGTVITGALQMIMI